MLVLDRVGWRARLRTVYLDEGDGADGVMGTPLFQRGRKRPRGRPASRSRLSPRDSTRYCRSQHGGISEARSGVTPMRRPGGWASGLRSVGTSTAAVTSSQLERRSWITRRSVTTRRLAAASALTSAQRCRLPAPRRGVQPGRRAAGCAAWSRGGARLVAQRAAAPGPDDARIVDGRGMHNPSVGEGRARSAGGRRPN